MPYLTSRKRPRNTSEVVAHCTKDIGLLKNITDNRMVKNFRVVVIMEQGSGPKSATVMKMKYCNKQ